MAGKTLSRSKRDLPPIVRLQPKGAIESVFSTSARVSVVLLGILATVTMLIEGREFLLPVVTAIIVGLMLGPIADRLERQSMGPGLSAAIVVVLLLLAISAIIVGFAVPLSSWIDRLPKIWANLEQQLFAWNGVMTAIADIQASVRDIGGKDAAMAVTVEDGGAVQSVAAIAPAVFAQILIFLASLYFFIATRKDIRIAVLRLCVSRQARWRFAHIFRDVETHVARYLSTITIINIGMAVVVSFAMWVLGVPSPVLWGILAGTLNYVIYVGPALMTVILLAVGLSTFDTPGAIIMPAVTYLGIHLTEGQFVTPHWLGRSMTINPFIIFLATMLWIWLWGPVGGFIAVPLLIIAATIIHHVIPLVDKRRIEV